MPNRAPSRCAQPGCRTLTTGGRCPEHRRPSSSGRGYGRAWRAQRSAFLALNPGCTLCGGVATEVDHVQPHRGMNDPLFWRVSNWRAVCKPCHSRKSAGADGSFEGRA